MDSERLAFASNEAATRYSWDFICLLTMSHEETGRLLARSCRSGMSDVWSLPEVNRTWRGEPNSVEIDPLQTSDVPPNILHSTGPEVFQVSSLEG